jgi:pimeloyl-ACP methyl ester carboxylesterase
MAIQSDWDEIDRVVDFARGFRGVDTVSIIAWSRGGPRAGGYAASHPEKVDRLFLYSPAVYDRFGPSAPPLLPEPGFLMQLNTPSNAAANWDIMVGCSNQFNPEVRAHVAATDIEQDPAASAWGDGKLWRAPVQNTLWGWNAETARRLQMPAIIIRGDLDTQAPGPLQRDLFADLATRRKVFVTVTCASHFMVWENQHMILLNASAEWLRSGTFADQMAGVFVVGTDGRVRPETTGRR